MKPKANPEHAIINSHFSKRKGGQNETIGYLSQSPQESEQHLASA
jgi:hypothetical protein